MTRFAALSLSSMMGFVTIATIAAAGAQEPGSQGFSIEVVTPIQFKGYAATTQGQELSVYDIAASLHEMNVPGGLQPVDLELHFTVAEDPTVGNLAFCKAAFNRVALDQKNAKSTDTAFPYLQVSIDRSYPKMTTDDGTTVYPDRAINCWEVLDAKVSPPPLGN